MRRRAIPISPSRPEPNSQTAAGIGTGTAWLAKPVIDVAPGLLLAHPVPLGMQGNRWIAAIWSLLLPVRTCDAELHELVPVAPIPKLISVDEWDHPSKLVILRLKLPKPSSLPEPALLQVPGVKPVREFDPEIVPRAKVPFTRR